MRGNDIGTNKLHQAEKILSEALKLNSDLGYHVKNCSFSTHLTGRFYQNNSLESHKARSHRIAQMKAKRKQLEKSLELEERKILFLEKKLKERQLQRFQAEEMKKRAEKAAILIQSHARRILSTDKLEVLRVESEIINYIVRFIQAMFRGKRDRIRVHNLRISIIQHRKEELAAIKIQSNIRQFLAKVTVGRKLEEQMIQHNMAACAIQSSVRGFRDRRFAHNLKRERCVIKIQSQYRGMVGRRIRDARKKARRGKREKTQRIPLHERRYSTYSIESSRKGSVSSSRKDSLAKRRFTEISSLSKTSLSSGNDRRLTGLEILRLMHNKEHQKENTEVDTNSKTSCVHHDRRDKSVSTQKHSKNHISEEKSIKIVSASTSKSPSVSASTSASTEVDDEQIRLSRQRAAVRAAKLRRQTQQQREEKLKHATNRKKELDQLEKKRRNMMKQRMMAKAERKLSNKGKEKKAGVHNSLTSTSNDSSRVDGTSTVCETCGNDNDRTQKLQDDSKVCDVGLGIDLDDNFEEDFCENEFDLDDMG